MRPSRVFATVAASTLLLGLIGSSGTAAAPPPLPPRKAAPAVTAQTITLITGDRVTVRSTPGQPEQVQFVPVRGSRSTGAVTSRVGGHTTVIPANLLSEVATGRIDRHLFDIDTLLAEKYDDSASKVMPVIIGYAGTQALARGRARNDVPKGATRTRLLPSIGSRAVAMTKSAGSSFWASVSTGDRLDPQIARIRLDHRIEASTDRSVPQIGAPAAWERGFTGRGVKVAVLDTGIDTGHPDLTGMVIASEDFTGFGDPVDHYGHGTHVAGIIAGSGAASDGKYRGVAPDASLLNGKVLDDSGFGSDSGIIAGMEWAVAQGADVVNLSLGGGPTDGTDPLSQAVDTLSRQSGTLFVVAAGNCELPGAQQVSTPAAADTALAVANLERDGSVNPSSCQGPRYGDSAFKPQIGAPGTDIVAARAAGTDIGTPVGDRYTTLTGTSMATPHVAGTAALLAQAQPDWNGTRLRERLLSTADPQGADPVSAAGTGRVDADQATDGGVEVDTGELDFGYLKWPHTDQQPITKQLTYTNPGSTAVTLTLSATTDDGSVAPKPVTSRITVPAGGTATAGITLDPSASGYGKHTGRVLATPASGDPLVTAIGWLYEDERVELTIHAVDRSGAPATTIALVGRPDDKPLTGLPLDGVPVIDGTATVRVPPGTVDVSAFITQEATDRRPLSFSLVADPQVTLTEDTTATLDARKARPAGLSVAGRPGLDARYRVMRYDRTTASGALDAIYALWFPEPAARFYAAPTRRVTIGDLEYRSGGRLEVAPFRARIVGGAALAVADVDYSPRFTGVRNLVAVDAGRGTPDELGGVRGKLAVIRYDPTGIIPDPMIEDVENAGAAAVLLYDPDAADLVRTELFSTAHTIPVLRTTRAEAAKLLAAMRTGPVTIRITGLEWTPVVYDLLAPTRGRIPAEPGLVARPSTLARIDERFGAHRATGTQIVEDRVPLSPLDPPFLVQSLDPVPVLPVPAKRTAFVSTGSGLKWSQHVLVGIDGWWTTGPRAYAGGSRSRIGWFEPVANSGLSDQIDSLNSVEQLHDELGDNLKVCFDAIGRSKSYEMLFGPRASTLSVRRNGEDLGTVESNCAYYPDVPKTAADYEVTLDAAWTPDTSDWSYSRRVRSTWSFHAAGGQTERMPVILADLRVPSASLLNQVRAGRPADIRLGLRHQAGSTGSAFDSAKLELSYDGTTWTGLALRRTGKDAFAATVAHPASAAGKKPSLRLTVTDAAGGRLTQEITDAYGIVG